ncbi:PorP/SprF family type IX secretion system membrane protein [Chitinophaga japonensis]|uniref:Type IX secretion system PorP/SprF family membrane protein n=1 Tax=Chitinophaga japonensis TaxID=104662 RepID=A0A562STC9_CHIJA|nr:type IX secretion system membrane protein PorP/SprF [Chitinophaga japonensis]TWI84505.1 type IX secretion system PorP/SprF family membrane protein [Chitinophaga japonensis]
MYVIHKKCLALALVLFTGVFSARAQQQPHYTQYIMNPFIINPAVAGIENYWDIKASHRHQWAGLNGSPVTTYLTVHGPLRKSDYPQASPTGFDIEGDNPRGRAYWMQYEAPPAHPGVGLTILNDRTGPLSRFSFSGTYAHHIGLAPRTSLSAGISVGMQSVTLDANKLEFQDPNDPVIAGSALLDTWKPEVSAGLWLYSANYFIGASAQNIIPMNLGFDNGKVVGDSVYRGKLVPHLFLTTGYRMWLNDDISLLPSVMVKYITAAPVSFDINAKAQYRDRVWVGASYRYNDGIAAMLGVNISSTFNIGYSYDYTGSSLNTVSKGSHEIVVGFLIGNRYGDLCPRNIW